MSRQLRILLVEDDGDSREVFKAILRSGGYDVIEADDGITALRLLETTYLDLVVLDIGLPFIGGRDVLVELHGAGTCKLPIVVVTGRDASELDGVRADCVLHKPVPPDMLLEAVRNCSPH